MPILAASLEGTILLIIVAVISAIYQKLTKKGEASGEDDNPLAPEQRRTQPPPRTLPRSYVPPPATPKKVDWEEELRRALEGATPTTRPNRSPVPPPPTIPTAPPTRERSEMPLPKVFVEEKHYKGHCVNCGSHLEFPVQGMGQVIACPVCHQPTVLRPFRDTPVETISHSTGIAPLHEAAAHLHDASQMDERVAAELAAVRERPAGSTEVQAFKKRSAEIDETVALLRRPTTARQVVLASVILSPPKALEL